MNGISTKNMLFAVGGVLLAAATSGVAMAQIASTPPQPLKFTVDCNHAQTVSATLSRVVLIPIPVPVTIVVQGTCREFVTITRNDVTLQGDPIVGGGITAPDSTGDAVTITGARATLIDLTVTGGSNGISALAASTAALQNVTVTSAARTGIFVRTSDLSMDHCMVTGAASVGLRLGRNSSARVVNGSQLRANGDAGIYAENHATLVTDSSSITDNGSHGVQLETAAQASINGGTIANNGRDPSKGGTGVSLNQAHASLGGGINISGNREEGVRVTISAAGIYNATLTGNGNAGVTGYLGAVLDIINTRVANNPVGIACQANCTAQFAGVTAQNNTFEGIALSLGSKLILSEPNTVSTGNGGFGLNCRDKLSSVDGVPTLFIGTVAPTCNGFF